MASYIPRPTPLPSNRSVKEHFTSKELFEAVLYELNKVSAPSIDLDTFVHFANVGNDNYHKKRYNVYAANQQVTDDLRELSATRLFTTGSAPIPLDQANERFALPEDYYHMLSCVVFWEVLEDFKNYRAGSTVEFAALRGTQDRFSQVLGDHYNKPSYKMPYFEVRAEYCEIRAGKHDSLRLLQIEASFLMLPEEIVLTSDDLDDPTVDPSQVLKQRATVTYEVLKEIVALILENQANPRTASKIQVDQAIAPPAPQGAPAPAPRGR